MRKSYVLVILVAVLAVLSPIFLGWREVRSPDEPEDRISILREKPVPRSDALRSEGRAQAVAPAQLPSPALSQSDAVDPRFAEMLRNDEYVRGYHDRVMAQPVDKSWAVARESDIRQILSSGGLPSGSYVDRIKCASSLCEVVIGSEPGLPPEIYALTGKYAQSKELYNRMEDVKLNRRFLAVTSTDSREYVIVYLDRAEQ